MQIRHHTILLLCAFVVSVILLAGIAPIQQDGAMLRESGSICEVPSPIAAERHPKHRVNVLRDLTSKLNRSKNDATTDATQDSAKSPVAIASQSEAPYLKSLASWLSVKIPRDATPGDIECAIRQRFLETHYPGEILSDEAFVECCAAIPTTRDTETFKAYHAFIKKIAGKRMVILECKE